MRYYVDTSVWMDLLESRSDGIRPLDELAFQFLKKCQRRKDTVIVSNEVEGELLVYYSEGRIKDIFSDFKDVIVKVISTKEQRAETYSFWIKTGKKFPSLDILHSIIARDNNAILISRDWHFSEIGIVECMFPEDID